MRNCFANYLTEIAKNDNRIVLMMGDIGNRMFDDFKKVAPERFINCGIAEANMMSMAAGLAMNGMRPFVYTITPFATLRCLEQIRTSVAYHDAKVVIVGTGSGISYAELGPTHHSLDDIGILSMIPNLSIFTPSDPNEVSESIEDAINSNYPSYIRLGKKGEPNLIQIENQINTSTSKVINNGNKNILLTHGPISNEALSAANELNKNKIDLGVATIRRIHPIDQEFFKSLITNNFINWFVLEEHYKKGGLYSTLVIWLYENNFLNKVKLKSLAFEHKFIHEIGKQEYIRKNFKLDSNSIAKFIEKNID